MDPPQQAVFKTVNRSALMLRTKEDEEHHQEEAHSSLRHRSLNLAFCPEHTLAMMRWLANLLLQQFGFNDALAGQVATPTIWL